MEILEVLPFMIFVSLFLFRLILAVKFQNTISICHDLEERGFLKIGSIFILIIFTVFIALIVGVVSKIALMISVLSSIALSQLVKKGEIKNLNLSIYFAPWFSIRWGDKKSIIARVDFTLWFIGFLMLMFNFLI